MLAPLLRVGLELLLESCELGKGRIRIRGLVAALPDFAAALEVLGAQLGIAIRTIAAPGPFRTPGAIAPIRTVTTTGAITASRTILIGAILIGTILIRTILIGAPLAMPAWLTVLLRIRSISGLA